MNRPAIRTTLAATVALATVAVAPPAADADLFGGGRFPGAGFGSKDDAVVAVSVQGSAVVVAVTAGTARCYSEGIQRLRTSLPDPVGWTGFTASRTVTVPQKGRASGKVTITVALQRVGGDALTGTVRLNGRLRRGARGRLVACDDTIDVALRSSTPASRAGAPLVAPRYGATDERVNGGVPGAFLMVPRSATSWIAAWTTKEQCVVHGRRLKAQPLLNVAPSFRVGDDGRFRDVDHERYRSGRYHVRFTGVLRGAIGADGIARGSVRISERYTRPRTKRFIFYPVNCTSPTSSFVATP